MSIKIKSSKLIYRINQGATEVALREDTRLYEPSSMFRRGFPGNLVVKNAPVVAGDANA